MEERAEMLESCPQCRCKVVWNGVELVCVACSWTERRAKSPSAKRIDIPRKCPVTRVKRDL